MRRIISTAFFVTVLSVITVPLFANHAPLTGRDAVDLWAQGASPAEIVQAVRASGAYQRLSSYDVAMMRDAGMPAALIDDLAYEFDRAAGYGYRTPVRPYGYGPRVYAPRPSIHLDLGVGRGHRSTARGSVGHGGGYGRGSIGRGSTGHGRGNGSRGSGGTHGGRRGH